ncbi:Cadherin domain-containing protein, partial [Allopseudospirillum japonicum]
NDAPTLSGGPYAFTATDEDTASTGVLISTLLAGVTAADMDGDTLGAAISAQTGNGTWQYSTDNTSWTDFGSVGSANSLLLSDSTYVRYNPDGENGETASLTLYAWDGSSGTASSNGSTSTASTIINGDATAFSTETINANLTVNPLNDAPSGTDKTLTAQKNSALTIQVADTGFNDVDTGDALEQITLSTAPALGTLWVDTDGDGTVNGSEAALSTSDTVTATDISAGLLKYRPATDGVGAAYTTIGFTVNDGDANAASANTWTLDVVSAPEIDLNGAASGNNATATYTENDTDTPVTLVDAAASITDDDANLKSMSIQISDGAQTGDVIKLGSHADNATVNGITISYTSDSEISLSGSATKENYLALLKELNFAQTGDKVGGVDRTISVTATDANDQTGLASTITVTATSVNDAPTVATNIGVTLDEAATITIGNTQLNATDPDDTASGLTYTVTTATTKGTLWLDANNSGTQDDGEALALNGTFTQDDIDNSRLKYTHDGGETTSDTLGFSLADGGEDSVSPVSGQSFAITVTPQNDVPTISELSGNSLAYLIGSDALVIDQGTAVSVTDPDSTDFNTGTLTVSITNNGVNAEDKLSIRNQGTETGQIGVSGSDVTYGGTSIGSLAGGTSGTDLTVDLNTNATAAALSALLGNITYENLDSTTATENTRTVRFVLTDGDGGTSANIDTSVVVSSNAAPVITSNSGGDTAAINVAENSTTVTMVTATDAEDDTLAFSISGGADSTLFSIDANSGALTFKAAPDYENPQDQGDTAGNNTYVVEVQADDSNGGTDTQTLTVTVTDVNETPPSTGGGGGTVTPPPTDPTETVTEETT